MKLLLDYEENNELSYNNTRLHVLFGKEGYYGKKFNEILLKGPSFVDITHIRDFYEDLSFFRICIRIEACLRAFMRISVLSNHLICPEKKRAIAPPADDVKNI